MGERPCRAFGDERTGRDGGNSVPLFLFSRTEGGRPVPAKILHGVTDARDTAQRRAQSLADEMGLELVEVTLQKEPRGLCLCVYLDKADGLSLDDCEAYHKRLQPLVDDLTYDFLDVSSPGLDRPVKTRRDFLKNEGAKVDVRLFAPQQGANVHTGLLQRFDDAEVVIEADGQERSFPRKSVAIVKPVIEFDDDEELPTTI